MSVAIFATRPTGPAATPASAPRVYFPFMMPSMLRGGLKTSTRSVDSAPICQPLLPLNREMNTGLLHVPSVPRPPRTPRPYCPPTTNPTLMTPGTMAIPLASASRAGGIALSGISMIFDKTSVADSTRPVFSFRWPLFFESGAPGIFDPCAGVEPAEILLPAPVLHVHHRAERLFEPVPPDREDAVAVDDRFSRSADHRGDAPRP